MPPSTQDPPVGRLEHRKVAPCTQHPELHDLAPTGRHRLEPAASDRGVRNPPWVARKPRTREK
eukprot:1844323-Prorocentrum_lima.AAC.1